MRVWLVALGVSLGLILLGLCVAGTPWDINTFIALNSFYPSRTLWLSITEFGDFLIVGCLAYVLFRTNVRWLFGGLIAGLATQLLSHFFKHYFSLLRPENVLDASMVHLLGPAIDKTSYSMPSGHCMAISMLACYFSLILFTQKKAVALVLIGLVGCVALSRVGVGAHWPSDCIAGVGFGLVAGLMGWLALKVNISNLWVLRVLALFIHFTFLVFIVMGFIKANHYVGLYPVSAGIYGLAGSLAIGFWFYDLWKTKCFTLRVWG